MRIEQTDNLAAFYRALRTGPGMGESIPAWAFRLGRLAVEVEPLLPGRVASLDVEEIIGAPSTPLAPGTLTADHIAEAVREHDEALDAAKRRVRALLAAAVAALAAGGAAASGGGAVAAVTAAAGALRAIGTLMADGEE